MDNLLLYLVDVKVQSLGEKLAFYYVNGLNNANGKTTFNESSAKKLFVWSGYHQNDAQVRGI